MRVRWHKPALAQLIEAIAFARLESEESGVRLSRAMDAGIEQLLQFPESGRPGARAGTRELLVARGTYLIVYQPSPDYLVIVGVRHTKRRPASGKH